MPPTIFHLSFPVKDFKDTKEFYVDGLGCRVGRESRAAITLDFGGHQIVAQLSKEPPAQQRSIYPRHFGLVFESEHEWRTLADRAKSKNLKFFREPCRRYEGTRVEHLTFFLEDPSNNLLEFKYYTHQTAVFGEQEFPSVGDDTERT